MITFYLLVVMSCLFVLSEEAPNKQKCGCTESARRAAFEELEKKAKQDGSVLVDDMIMTVKDLSELFKGGSKFLAAGEAKRRWPRGEVFYEMSRMKASDQKTIRRAVTMLSQATNGCVRFTEVKPGHNGPHVSVFSGNGCFSAWGRQGGKQDMSLAPFCLQTNRTIMHEFMHALGFKHEHVRPDRDKFVRIQWGDILTSVCNNFKMCKDCTTTTPYDKHSIMHYSSSSWSCKNGTDTILTIRGEKIPFNLKLTQYDVKKIKDYYKCH